jgi:hypothetical protein
MSWLITPQLKVLNGVTQESILGIPFGGGYFAGYISHTADGNPTHALIVAPAATGATGTGYTLTTMLQWKTTETTTAETNSGFDGLANTAAMVTAGIANHPAAEFCVNLNIAGYTDWYLPARFELEIAYFNLKPSTAANNASFGINDYSVPKRTANYTTTFPAQTNVAAFTTSAESFNTFTHWTSTETNATTSWRISFSSGSQSSSTKSATNRTRAFRRIAL